jgi:hypothetical protein
MKAALIDNQGTVLNVIVWGDNCVAPPGTMAFVVEDDFMVAPGWTLADGEFAPPVAPVEETPEPVEALVIAVEALAPSIEE